MASLIWVRLNSCSPPFFVQVDPSTTRWLLPTESWNISRQETFGVDRNQEVGYEACFYVDYEGKLVRVESATCGYTEHPDSTHPYGKYKAPQFP